MHSPIGLWNDHRRVSAFGAKRTFGESREMIAILGTALTDSAWQH